MPSDKRIPIPNVGDEIYVDTSAYLSYGRHDFQGGKVRVQTITIDSCATWVTISERPGTKYNWDVLGPRQERLKKKFGENRGYRDPDYRPQMDDDS